nr:hypothetical protein [Roseovarius sp. W115]
MRVLFFVVSAGVGLSLAFVASDPVWANENKPLVVRNDRGGELKKRLHQLSELRQSGRPVEIRGGVCFSTCTMFLSLPQTCVLPRTTFGFHGPSSYGRPLAPKVFEEASHVIADHYPPALRRWYLETGRYRIRTLYRIRGAKLIELGVQAC